MLCLLSIDFTIVIIDCLTVRIISLVVIIGIYVWILGVITSPFTFTAFTSTDKCNEFHAHYFRYGCFVLFHFFYLLSYLTKYFFPFTM